MDLFGKNEIISLHEDHYPINICSAHEKIQIQQRVRDWIGQAQKAIHAFTYDIQPLLKTIEWCGREALQEEHTNLLPEHDRICIDPSRKNSNQHKRLFFYRNNKILLRKLNGKIYKYAPDWPLIHTIEVSKPPTIHCIKKENKINNKEAMFEWEITQNNTPHFIIIKEEENEDDGEIETNSSIFLSADGNDFYIEPAWTEITENYGLRTGRKLLFLNGIFDKRKDCILIENDEEKYLEENEARKYICGLSEHQHNFDISKNEYIEILMSIIENPDAMQALLYAAQCIEPHSKRTL